MAARGPPYDFLNSIRVHQAVPMAAGGPPCDFPNSIRVHLRFHYSVRHASLAPAEGRCCSCVMASRLLLALLLFSAAWLPSSAEGLSLAEERKIGKRFDMMAHARMPLVRDPEFVSFVDDMGREILAQLGNPDFEYHFSVVRDASINAFAVPGGYIYVNVGLINRADYDDEVAAVLGHEIAHVHGHHIARQQEKTQLLNYASILGMLAAVVNPALAPVAAATGQALALKYQREFEQEADYLGVRYLRGTPYDPRATLDFFKKLDDESRITPSFFPPYLRTHPMTDERLNHLEAVLKAKQWEGHKRSAPTLRLQRLQALARARSDSPQDVFEQYATARAENPGNPNADYLFGVVALEINRLEEARRALEQALGAGFIAAERELGRVALRQRQPERAVGLLRRHLEREAGDGMAWVELARAHEALKDTAAAKEAYLKGIEAVPELDVAHYGFGLLAGRDGDQGAGFYHLGVAARIRGQYPKALESLNRAIPLLSDDTPRRKKARREVDDLEEFLQIESEDEE